MLFVATASVRFIRTRFYNNETWQTGTGTFELREAELRMAERSVQRERGRDRKNNSRFTRQNLDSYDRTLNVTFMLAY